MATHLAVAAGAAAAELAALTGWAWSAAPAGSVATPDESATPVVDGPALFKAKGCATCHAGPDGSGRIEVAPSLAQASTWAGTRRAGTSAEDYLRESISAPGAFVSPVFTPTGGIAAMPSIAVSPAELEALVDYLLAPG